MITCREFNGFLIDYRSGDLTLDERARFETHLAECSHCVAYLRSYEETIRLAKGAFSHLDDAMTEDVPDGLVRARGKRGVQPKRMGSNTPKLKTKNHNAGAGVPTGRRNRASRAAMRGSSRSQSS